MVKLSTERMLISAFSLRTAMIPSTRSSSPPLPSKTRSPSSKSTPELSSVNGSANASTTKPVSPERPEDAPQSASRTTVRTPRHSPSLSNTSRSTISEPEIEFVKQATSLYLCVFSINRHQRFRFISFYDARKIGKPSRWRNIFFILYLFHQLSHFYKNYYNIYCLI